MGRRAEGIVVAIALGFLLVGNAACGRPSARTPSDTSDGAAGTPGAAAGTGGAGTSGVSGASGSSGVPGDAGVAPAERPADTSGAPPPPDVPDEPTPIIINAPWGLALDDRGHLLVADAAESLDPAKLVDIDVAADTGVVIPLDFSPQNMTGDGARTVFFGTGYGNTVDQVSIDTGVHEVIAGTYTPDAQFLDATGAAARFGVPRGVAYDGVGNLFVVDYENDMIRKVVVATGVVSTVAGKAKQVGDMDEVGEAARFHDPVDIAIDPTTKLIYVTDLGNGTIRVIDPGTRAVTTFSADVQFSSLGAIAADGQGKLYVSDYGTILEIVIATGAVKTIAGKAGATVARDGVGEAGEVRAVSGMVLDGRGTMYFTDCETVRKLTLATGAVTTLYGDPTNEGIVTLGCVTKGSHTLTLRR
jgi:DNA-binding beta-propeller fold protein YncE